MNACSIGVGKFLKWPEAWECCVARVTSVAGKNLCTREWRSRSTRWPSLDKSKAHVEEEQGIQMLKYGSTVMEMALGAEWWEGDHADCRQAALEAQAVFIL